MNQSSDTDSGSDHKMGDKKMEEKKAFSTQLAMKIKVPVRLYSVQARKAVARTKSAFIIAGAAHLVRCFSNVMLLYQSKLWICVWFHPGTFGLVVSGSRTVFQ
jgi:hypothetical protein